MADGEDKDGQDIIFNAVDDAIVTHPYPIARTAFEYSKALPNGWPS
jgi:hypothetical protein